MRRSHRAKPGLPVEAEFDALPGPIDLILEKLRWTPAALIFSSARFARVPRTPQKRKGTGLQTLPALPDPRRHSHHAGGRARANCRRTKPDVRARPSRSSFRRATLSTRLPAKPLLDLGGKPMVVRWPSGRPVRCPRKSGWRPIT